MASRVVSVKLQADVGGYVSSMEKAAKATASVGTSATDSSSRMGKGFDMAGRGATLLGGVLAGGVALGIKSVVGAASDLNETMSKSAVIFGSNSGRIEQWANGAAKNFGLSKQAALEAAASFGNMFTQLGFAGDQAASSSQEVVKLAADLGSFNNLDTGDVLERIQAAFRGEYDSLQLLIPNINAARVEQEAMAETGKANATQLTAQEKATATLAIVQRDGAAAANDFAETSGGLANSTKTATADFEDLKAKIGQEFLPIAQSAMHFLSDTAIPVMGELAGDVADLVKWFGDLPGPMQVAIVAAAGWALAGGKIIGAFGSARDKLIGFREEQELQRALFQQQANGISDVDRALGGLGNELDTTGSKMGAAKAVAGQFAKAIGPELGIAAVTYGLGLLATDFGKMTDAGGGARAEIQQLDKSLKEVGSSAGRIDATTDGIVQLRNSLREVNQVLEDSGGDQGWAGFLGAGVAISGQVASMKDASVSAQDLRDKIDELEAAQRRTDQATDGLSQRFGLSRATVLDLADKYGVDLSQGLGAARQGFLDAGIAGDIATGSVVSVGNAAGMTEGQIEEASAAIEQWRGQLQSIGESFVEPLSVYKSLLDEKTAAERQAAEDTAAATASSSDSWADYVGTVTLSLDEYATKLQEQITAQENWRENIAAVTARGGLEVGQILASMGQEGAGLVQQMVNATDADFTRLRDLMIQDARNGSQGAATELDQGMQIMAAAGNDGAYRTAAGIANQLGIGVDTVARIAAQYGVTLADGVNPLLVALGQHAVAIQRNINANRSGFGLAFGGEVPGSSPHDRADNVPIMATAGEFMQSRPAVRKYGTGFMEAVNEGRFPADLARGFAFGGFISAGDVPRPPSTSPYGPPVSTAGDAAMDTAYRAASAYVQEQGPWGRGLAWAKTQVGKPYIWGGVGPSGFDCSGFQSAITNVIMGRSPNSRIGATATFPWKGFIAGDGVYTIGSTKDAGGGIGHMAGTLLGVNVESRGGQGVVVGGSARGAHAGLFGTHAHLAMADGGVIGEPVFGVGLESGNTYSFAEHGPEVVLPRGREFSGGGAGWGGGGSFGPVTVNARVFIGNEEITSIARVEAEGVVTGALNMATTRARYNG